MSFSSGEVIIFFKAFNCLDEAHLPGNLLCSNFTDLNLNVTWKYTFSATSKTESGKLIWLMQDFNLNRYCFQWMMLPNPEVIIHSSKAKLVNPLHEDMKGHSIMLPRLILLWNQHFFFLSQGSSTFLLLALISDFNSWKISVLLPSQNILLSRRHKEVIYISLKQSLVKY